MLYIYTVPQLSVGINCGIVAMGRCTVIIAVIVHLTNPPREKTQIFMISDMGLCIYGTGTAGKEMSIFMHIATK